MATGFIQQLAEIKSQKAKLDEQLANGIALREQLTRECNALEMKKKLLTQETETLDNDVASKKALKDDITHKYDTVKAKHAELSAKVLQFTANASALEAQAQKILADATQKAENIVRDAEDAIKSTNQQIEGAKNTLAIINVSIDEANVAKGAVQQQESKLNEVVAIKQEQLVDTGNRLKAVTEDIRNRESELTSIHARITAQNAIHSELCEKVSKESQTLETLRTERKAAEAEVEQWSNLVTSEKKKYEEAQKALTLLDDEKKALQEINSLLS